MKLKLVLILISSFQLSAAVYSQDNRLTLKMEDASLEQVIWEIQKQTDFVFMYGTRDITKVTNLTVDMTDKTVNEILDQCLRHSGLVYTISGNAVIIKRADDDKKEMTVIKGVVKDKNGDPPGVTIIEELPSGLRPELMENSLSARRKRIALHFCSLSWNEDETGAVERAENLERGYGRRCTGDGRSRGNGVSSHQEIKYGRVREYDWCRGFNLERYPVS
ncbi:MAG: STN domain-containing protein [Butyricimonas paravirosa]